jgi:hypothetical protein
MKERIIRKGNDVHWHICTLDFKSIPETERKELEEYFDEMEMPYHFADGDILIDGSIEWITIDEIMTHFYDGWAVFTPL